MIAAKRFTVHEVADKLNVSTDTIRRWEKKGLIRSTRSTRNYRLFDLDEVKRIMSRSGTGGAESGAYKVLKSKPAGYSSIELFSGCGGLALGLENAGFSNKLLVEIDKPACDTLKLNRQDWNLLPGDIHVLNDESVFDRYYGEIDLVAGGFPCQAFSYSGKGLGFGDPRGTLFFEYLKVIKAVQPRIALAENVRGLLRHDGGKTLSTIVNCLEREGYAVRYHLAKAQFLDVPQKRERLLIIGIRKDQELYHLFPSEKDYIITLREALKGVPDSPGQKYPPKKARVLSMVPEGGYWRDLPEDIQKDYMGKSYYLSGGKTGMARRMSWDEPSLTLTCSPAQKQTERAHPSENRPFSVREYARIQTFPDDWQFSGSVAQQYKQIGNAVPVNLGYHIGRSLIRTLKGEKPEHELALI